MFKLMTKQTMTFGTIAGLGFLLGVISGSILKILG